MMVEHNALIRKLNEEIAGALPYKGTVLDLGCGTAPYRSMILRTAQHYIGIDWPNSGHGSSSVDSYANISQGVPIASESVEMVVSFQVLEHLAEPFLFLQECFRVLKTDGELFITVPFMWHVHEEPFDYFRYTRFGLEYMLQKAGFDSIEITENTGYWQTTALKFNYQSKRYARGLAGIVLQLIWALDQAVAPMLDRLDWNPKETASYTVRAAKRSISE